ncbi:MAG: hypothetical protein Q8P31_09975 [Bacillota bacterium]|nr:hypothetical protein [Bacillota bacterium]
MYSLGDILVTGATFQADGVMYAPNGQFESHGSTLSVTGSIVAGVIDFAGVTVTVVHEPAAPDVFPGGSVRLTR